MCRPAVIKRARYVWAVPCLFPNSGANARHGLAGRFQLRGGVGNASAHAGLRRNACPCPALGARRHHRCSTRRPRRAGKRSRASRGCWNRRPLATSTSVGSCVGCVVSGWHASQLSVGAVVRLGCVERQLDAIPIPAAGLPGHPAWVLLYPGHAVRPTRR